MTKQKKAMAIITIILILTLPTLLARTGDYDDFEDENYNLSPVWDDSAATGSATVNGDAAKFGDYGLNFDNVNGAYVQLITTITPVATMDSWTWIRTTSTGAYATYEFMNETGGRYGNIGINGGNFQWLDNVSPYYHSFTATPSLNTWYILRAKWDGTKMHYYVYNDSYELIEQQLNKNPWRTGNVGKVALFVQNYTGEVHLDDTGYGDGSVPGPEDSCSCPESGNWEITGADECTLEDTCNITGDLHIVNGSLVITSTGTLTIPTGKKAIITDGNTLAIESGGKLVIAS